VTARWTPVHTLALFALIVAVVVIGGYWPRDYVNAFYATLALLTALAAVIGLGVTGLWLGVLIDEDNRISLSRFQLVLWTILLVGGLAMAVFGNLFRGFALPSPMPPLPGNWPECSLTDPLHIYIAPNVWALMGITITTAVGGALLNQSNRSLQRKRLSNDAPDKASWADLFVFVDGSARRVDMTRVQKFYFTVIVVVAYGTLLRNMFAGQSFVCRFPDLSPGMLVLLGISGAGYLAGKTIARA
jgi:hypothetical protein